MGSFSQRPASTLATDEAGEQNEQIRDEAAAAVDMLRRAAITPEFNQAINDAARRLKDGESMRTIVDDPEQELVSATQKPAQSRPSAANRSGQADKAGDDAGAGERGAADHTARTATGGQQGVSGEETPDVTLPTAEELEANG